MGDDVKAPCLICQKNAPLIEVMSETIERLLKEKAMARNEALEEAQTKGKPMSTLTEKEREDVYKYWLKSTTLTDEDGLIQITERAVLERLAGMELPEPEYWIYYDYEGWEKTGKEVFERTPEEDRAIKYTAAQLHQAYAQGAASQLSAEPVGYTNKSWIDSSNKPALSEEFNVPVYTLKEAK